MKLSSTKEQKQTNQALTFTNMCIIVSAKHQDTAPRQHGQLNYSYITLRAMCN